MKRSHKDAFDVLMENQKKPQYDYVGIPLHLKGLVKKCPQWREILVNMCGGPCRDIFMKMSYKDMEREVTNRNNLNSIHQCIKQKTINFCESLQKRFQQTVDGKSFPKSEQERYTASSFEKVRSLKARINGFIYGGKIYMEHLKVSKQFDGLLELKINASKRGETFYYRQLQVIFDEVNNVTSFLCTGYESIIEFVNRRCDITRQFQLDLQAKGIKGMATRNAAKMKRDQSLGSLGKAPSFFVPLANILLSVKSKSNGQETQYESTDDDMPSNVVPDNKEYVGDLNSTDDDICIVSDDEEPNKNEKKSNQRESEDHELEMGSISDVEQSDVDTFHTPWGGDLESDGEGEECHADSTDDDICIVSDDEEPNQNEKKGNQRESEEHELEMGSISNVEQWDVDTFHTDEPWGEDLESDGEVEEEKERHKQEVCIDEDELLNEILREI